MATRIAQPVNRAAPSDFQGQSAPRGLLAEREKVAGVTGLEPAASAVTGRRSNQLSYTPDAWATRQTPRGRAPDVIHPPRQVKKTKSKNGAKPRNEEKIRSITHSMVGGDGLEPPTSSV